MTHKVSLALLLFFVCCRMLSGQKDIRLAPITPEQIRQGELTPASVPQHLLRIEQSANSCLVREAYQHYNALRCEAVFREKRCKPTFSRNALFYFAP